MESSIKLSRRGLVRIISFTVALIVALTAATIGGYNTARRHRTTIEYTYQRALGELTEYLGNLDITLEKGKYAATASQLQGLTAKLWRDASFAKEALGQLPVSGSELTGTYKFLSQVGDFCMTLSARVAQGGTITEEETASLKQLETYSHQVFEQVAQLQNDAQAGLITLTDAAEGAEAALPDVGDGFHEMEEGFEDYPTLIYDGPFSDHIQQQKPKLLEGKDIITAEKAAAVAAEWYSGALEPSGETQGNLPCYIFTADNYRLSVTKAGGMLQYFLHSRSIGEGTLSMEQARRKGDEAMEEWGITGFRQSYYTLNNGVLLINYACTQDGVTLYPDLVKVGVAMDTGEIVSFDATGYIMNHTTRQMPAVEVSANEARQSLSPLLTVQGESRLAVVPSEGLTETLCHEFLCRGEDEEKVLVYVNVQTGQEEQILILLEDETGILTM